MPQIRATKPVERGEQMSVSGINAELIMDVEGPGETPARSAALNLQKILGNELSSEGVELGGLSSSLPILVLHASGASVGIPPYKIIIDLDGTELPEAFDKKVFNDSIRRHFMNAQGLKPSEKHKVSVSVE